MGVLVNPKPWVPYMNSKDCSQGFCSLYCPQWCYIIFPPPPPLAFPEDDDSNPNFSPLIIAIIGILASAFLLISYYTIISKYCGNIDSRRRRDQNRNPDVDFEDNHNPSIHEPWHVATNGLDEALIKSITVCKYKKGDGLVEGTDCSVCLSEFQEDENLRLLPKCSHAFHLPCIDMWLKSHSNCPLCRASVASVSTPLPVQTPQNPTHNSLNNVRLTEVEEIANDGVVLVAVSDVVISEDRNVVVEIREEAQQIRRSVSMDNACQRRVSVGDVMLMGEEDEGSPIEGVESSKNSKSSSRERASLHCAMSTVPIKRSFSSGRFFFGRHGRGSETINPV